MPTLAAHQTQYMPYPGVLHKLFNSDVFVFLDNVQYVKQEFQNRNRIRTPDGWQWLSIPVRHKSKPPIAEVFPVDGEWCDRHAKTVHAYYSHSPYLERMNEFWQITEKYKESALSTIAFETTHYLALMIGGMEYKKVKVVLESELNLTREETSTATKRLLTLCERFNCDRYLSGAGAKAYLDKDPWKKHNIELLWQDFHLKPYRQQYAGWEPNLSVVDLILNVSSPFDCIRE
jgi:hypothetical protein